jgi:hypothetical protein
MPMSPDNIKALLDELADWLEFEGVGAIDLLVCGGTAMGLQRLHNRTTEDVDVLGSWNRQLVEVACMDDFPEKVKACIQRVATNHPELQGFQKDWVNLGPQHLARQGLPQGYQSRLQSMTFGKACLLTLHLLDRRDLIPLKLYAAADRFSKRQAIHFDDLRLLRPTFDEMDESIDWVRTLKDFEEKRVEIQGVLERLGYDDLAGYV